MGYISALTYYLLLCSSAGSTTRGHNYKLFLRYLRSNNTFLVKELSQFELTWNATLLILAVLNVSKCLYIITDLSKYVQF